MRTSNEQIFILITASDTRRTDIETVWTDDLRKSTAPFKQPDSYTTSAVIKPNMPIIARREANIPIMSNVFRIMELLDKNF
ncbi:hypothetical protein V1477_011179 [Vespula maculifrons]|uniref:Uncharacterized protein n=1 Tax=Vespula maculifrons TaxID=7453 RepID=A0ABD2C461_VESMC